MCFKFLVKYLLFVFNLIFVIIGIAIIVLGALLFVKLNELQQSIPIDITAVPVIIIILGSVILLISFFGCCGSISESKCLLILYACFMAILAAAKIYIVINLLNGMDYYRQEIERFVDNLFEDPNQNVTFHGIEQVLKCCGTTGPDSYDGILQYLPPTCCEGVLDTCKQEGESNIESCLCEKDNAYDVGCSSLVGYYFAYFGEKIGYGIIIVIVVELGTMISASYLTCNIRSDTKR